MRRADHIEFCNILDNDCMTPEEVRDIYFVKTFGCMGTDEVYFMHLADGTYSFLFDRTVYECKNIEDMVKWIRKEMLPIEDWIEDALNDFCLNIQTKIGQKDGGAAANFFCGNAQINKIMTDYVLCELEDVDSINGIYGTRVTVTKQGYFALHVDNRLVFIEHCDDLSLNRIYKKLEELEAGKDAKEEARVRFFDYYRKKDTE